MWRTKVDKKIDELIRPPRPVFEGFDWTRTDRLVPTGAADRDKVLSERLQPATDLRGEPR